MGGRGSKSTSKKQKSKSGGVLLLPPPTASRSTSATDATQSKKNKQDPKDMKAGSPIPAETAVNNVNPNFSKGGGYRVNCQRCVVAFEMQRRGFDVEALPKTSKNDPNAKINGVLDNFGKTLDDRVFFGTKNNEILLPFEHQTNRLNPTQATKNILNTMSSWGEGSRAVVVISRGFRSGHVANIEYSNGNITLYDSQAGIKRTGIKEVRDYLKQQKTNFGMSSIFRSDDGVLKSDNLINLVEGR